MKRFFTQFASVLLTLVSYAFASVPHGALMATTITTAALNASYQSVYADGSKGLADLHAQVFFGASFDQLFTPVRTNLSVYRQSLSTSTSVAQAGQISFTPNGTYSFKPAETPLYWLKADYKGSSYKLRDTWLGSLHEKGVSEADQTFSKYIIDTYLVPQFVEDKELSGCYLGVTGTITEGTAGPVGEMMNGFRKTINTKITATTVSPISTGTIPTDQEDLVTYVEEFVKGINKRDWRKPMTLAMNENLAQMFREGMEQKYNSQYRNTEDLVRLKHFPNIVVSGQIAMGDSTKMFTSPASNLVHPYSVYEGDLVKFEVEDRSLKAWLDQDTGYGTIDDSRLYTNSEDLV